jgi:hypothetical protein
MNRYAARAAALLATAVVLVACEADAAGAPTPRSTPRATVTVEPTPSPSVAWATFTSDRYAYALEHPGDWAMREVEGELYLDGMRPKSPGTDNLIPPLARRIGGEDGFVVISAHELLPNETLDEFSLRAAEATRCGPGSGWNPATLGGEEALTRFFACGGYSWLQYAAYHGGRGYVIWLVATDAPLPQNRPLNDAILASFRFTD